MNTDGQLQPKIHDEHTRVVIDGNNICHHLLYIGTCQHYGGNYIEIRQNAQSFFQALLKCNIKPYVVFDGGHDDDDKKLQNIITKCELRMKENEEKPPKHMECFPVLAYESFTMVLKELNIPHLTCDGEADNQIAVLARQWNCPVISSDSDMYIFDLPGGFINFSDINLDQPTSDELNTRLYHASKFADSIGLHKTLLPVAATVLGSLYADIDYGYWRKIEFCHYFKKLEHFDWLPIQHISRPLRQIIYGLVLKSCTNGVEYVTEIVRDKRLMTKEPIKQVVEVAGYGILPTLQEIDGQDKRNKTKLLAAIFTFDEKILESLPSESRVFALTLKYFISNTCPHVTIRLKIYALCHVILLYREFPNVQSF
ncbi:Hypothetical predicted protein [Mytilus galloprovincialis]|uniref:Asteroid domain-containing protein n=1 Tax=Mytilus galloprovincialis TaxID=29158 RepID=A0A8B6D315_MYTGA|nr:Hypothetical predicted protein [Mytilus galloprovincialis]